MDSFHTRYRPKTFDEVLGQEATVRSLKRTIKDGRAHTFMFIGPAGTGKTTLARLLAYEIAGKNSINLIEHDAATKSGKEDIKELIRSLHYKAIGGSPIKFVILDECHKLTTDAWTLLLKPTEEPPKHVYFSFCSTEMGKIPKPILTRAQRYNILPCKEDDLVALLFKVLDSENLECADDIIELIAESSNGSPRQALVYLEACIGCKNITDARQIMRSAGQTKELIDLARWLVNVAFGKQTGTWKEAAKYIKALEGQDAESCRIVLVNYFAAVLLNQTQDSTAKAILFLVEIFSKNYSTTDKIAPLLHSVGLAIGLDN